MKALKLCDEQFMKHFHPNWTSTLNLLNYKDSMGDKNSLNHLKMGELEAIFVGDENLDYNEDTLFCWLRVLKDGGMLCLRAREKYQLDLLLYPFKKILKLVPNDNEHVWLFKKDLSLAGKSFIQCYVDLNNALLREDHAQVLSLAEEIMLLDQRSPHGAMAQIITYQKLGIPNQEEHCYRRVLRYTNTTGAYVINALNIIMGGDYLGGFKKREQIFEHLVEPKVSTRRSSTPPKAEWQPKRWHGEPLEDKHLVIWSEFGLGDEIMFAQLAHYLKTLGTKKITLVTQKPILSLLKTHPDIDDVVLIKSANEQLNEFDYWVYPHGILAYVKDAFQVQPKRYPYLFANSEKIEKFRKNILPSTKLNVGIVWRGNPSHENDHARSIHDLGAVEKLLKTENVAFYCLQKDMNEEERELLKKYHIPYLADDFHDMADTAAAISLLDCVVTVDTSVAHVAGALNKPTFLMLPYLSDWRWGSFQRENLWYPNMVSLRWRAMIKDWDYVVERVQHELANFKA